MRRAIHAIWKVVKPVAEIALAVVIVLGLVAIPTLAGSTGPIKDNLNGFVPAGQGGGGVVNTGPLVGDQSAFDHESQCMRQIAKDPASNMHGYYPAIGSAEHTDNVKSGVYPCATFTGDAGAANQVFQYKSETTYNQIGLVWFDGPNAGYLQGNNLAPPSSSGQYVSKFDPSTGKEIWRTPLTNINTTGQWIAAGSGAILSDHTIVTAAGPRMWKLDPDTGRILATTQVPINPKQPPTDANLDGLTVAPDARGTILMKTQNRPPGCPTQSNTAMFSCGSYGPNPDTTVVAVDPVTLKTLDWIVLNQHVTARPITTEWHGKTYMYLEGAKNLVRIRWNPKTEQLTYDKSWAPKYLLKGQTGGTAPGVMGKWIIWNTNSGPSQDTPQCVGTVSQDDPTDFHRICPWGRTFPVDSGATSSETPALVGVDKENSMFYTDDYLAKGVYGIKVDQATGQMNVAWSRGDWWSSDYFSMVGPADHRVLISQDISPDTKQVNIATNYSYTESVLWADAATGRTIAQSAANPSTIIGSLINVGYGGRIYTMGNDGSLFIYQVQACKDATINVTPPSNTTCPAINGSG